MSLFKKAVVNVFSNISKRFKYVLAAGYALFVIQLVVIAALYIVYLSSSTFAPELKYMAQEMTRIALSFITVVTIACITGDYILYGDQR